MNTVAAALGMAWAMGCGGTKTPSDGCAPNCDANAAAASETAAPDASADTARPSADSGTAATDSGGGATDTGSAAPDTDPLAINLVADPGFEEGSDAWNIWGGVERLELNPRTGRWALKLTATNGAEQRVTGLQPNTVYRLSGWGRNQDAEPLLLGVKDYGGEELRVAFMDPEYREDSLAFTTGFTNTAATIYAYKHAGEAPAHADDVVLVAEGPSDAELLWADEFDGSGPVDAARWTHEEGFMRNEELQWYQPDNATQSDGLLVIEARAEDRPNPDYVPGSSDWRTNRETITHSSASLTSRGHFGFQYGHLVVRAKVTNEVGTWPAIWTLGTECEWPSNGEVDVMENYGGDVLANFAWGSNVRWSPHWDTARWPVADFGAGWTDRFHIWEMEWTADRITIRMDGTVLNDVDLAGTVNGSAACAGANPFRQPHHIRLNLAIGGAGGSVESLALPTQYLVDYVRVYR